MCVYCVRVRVRELSAMMWWWWSWLVWSPLSMSISLILVLLSIYLLYSRLAMSTSRMRRLLRGRHVLITGGSSGIGRALATLVTHLGARVTLVARSVEGLASTKAHLESQGIKSKDIECVSVDVTADFQVVEEKLARVENNLGPIFLLVTCAGAAIPKTFTDQSEREIRGMMELNYLGTVSVLKALLPALKSRREGHLLLVSSQAGLLGLYGYTSYAASKFAVRGMAEALLMELKPFNIGVTVSCPPDTDTRGFEIEERCKPLATRKISQFAGNGVVDADIVAESMLKDALSNVFLSSPGLDGFFLTTVANAASDCTSIPSLIIQSITLGPLRIVSWVLIKCFHSIVSNCAQEEKKSETSSTTVQ